MKAGPLMQAMTAEPRTCVWPLELFSQSGCAGSKRSKIRAPRSASGREQPHRGSATVLEITSALRSEAVVRHPFEVR